MFGPLPLDNNEYKLNNDEINHYIKYGYISNIPILSNDDINSLINEFETFNNYNHKNHHLFHEYHKNEFGDNSEFILFHCLGHWRISPYYHDLVFHHKITKKVSQLLGDRIVRFWHDQMFVKPPHKGGNVAWHQDYSYWTRTIPMNHITVHIALDDQTEENGTLLFVPGSHKWTRNNGQPLPITSQHFDNMESVKEILTKEELEKWHVKPALLKKGEISIHHPLTIHGSYENKSHHPRRSAVLNYFADETKSNANEPLLDGIPIFPKGSKLKGKFFPVVYPPKQMN